MLTAFGKAARAYCKAKVEYLAVKAAMRATPCEYEGDPDCRPCWLAYRDGEIGPDEFCGACEGNDHHRDRRVELGDALPALAKKMYAAYRAEENDD